MSVGFKEWWVVSGWDEGDGQRKKGVFCVDRNGVFVAVDENNNG